MNDKEYGTIVVWQWYRTIPYLLELWYGTGMVVWYHTIPLAARKRLYVRPPLHPAHVTEPEHEKDDAEESSSTRKAHTYHTVSTSHIPPNDRPPTPRTMLDRIFTALLLLAALASGFHLSGVAHCSSHYSLAKSMSKKLSSLATATTSQSTACTQPSPASSTATTTTTNRRQFFTAGAAAFTSLLAWDINVQSAHAIPMITTEEFRIILRDSAQAINVVEFTGAKSETVTVKLVDGTSFGISDVVESSVDPRSPLKIAAMCRENLVKTKFASLEAALASAPKKKKIYSNERVQIAAEKEKARQERMEKDEADRLAQLYTYEMEQAKAAQESAK